MREFKVSRYIKKRIPLIVIACAIMTTLIYFGLRSSQTYVASTVIEYTDSRAEEGKTPTGAELDVNDIKSASIMFRVIENLGLDKTEYSADDLISRVYITAVPDPDEEARKEAILDEGKEYNLKPTRYIVSFTANSDEGSSFAQSVLDEILDNYYSEYSSNYVNEWAISNSIGDVVNSDYDYIQMLEIMDTDMQDTINSLYYKVNGSDHFRAASTGYSFADLAREFEFIHRNELSNLYARVFEHQITKDKATLIADYNNRIIRNSIDHDIKDDQVEDVQQIIDDYVRKMTDSGNTDITYEYILDEVYSRNISDDDSKVVESDKTVTYDKLIYNWRDRTDDKKYAVIDSAYCQYIIDVFSECDGKCGGKACERSDKTCSALGESGYDATIEGLRADIKKITDELDELYAITAVTNDEYNEYLGARHISTLSSVSVKQGTNVILYTAIAAIFFMVVCSCGAVFIGRLNDIIHYSFYTDHLTELNNSASLDNFIKSKANKILSNGTVCFTVQIKNTREINQTLGRSAGDQLLTLIAKILRETFSEQEAFLVYNGGASFIAFVAHMSYENANNSATEFRSRLNHREALKSARIEYAVGISESGENDARHIRKLLSSAMASKSDYVSESQEENK